VVTHPGLPQIRTKEESLEHADDLPGPEEPATDAIAELEGAVEELNAVLAFLENGEKK
jgi:type I restriction enzyme M protein